MASSSSQTPSSSMASTNSKTPFCSVSYSVPSTTSETPLSSSSTSSLLPWDVFLSFRGLDTRYKFTDHLYHALHRHGIRTYMDDRELGIGEVISEALPQAIQVSNIYIIVLSENYASSSWCLDELVEIYNCYESMQRLIIAVFYNINPSVVRHQTGSFKKAFKKHEKRAKPGLFRKASVAKMEKVNNWKDKLTKVAGFSGESVSAQRSEADILTEIVKRVLIEINPKTLNVAKYPVGLDSRVQDITALTRNNTEGVIRIGIHGMGGVGKTTLAKAVYNQNLHRFEGSCFLKNVREDSVTDQGLVCFQRQLINNVLKCDDINVDNVDRGIELIRARVCSKKVLIVFDDLDDRKPLEYLEGPFDLGSVIIITTRNEDLLDSIDVEQRYKVDELGDAESSQLFIQHALGNSVILSDTLKELSKEILQRAGGLPLALTVFGSKLLSEKKFDEGCRWLIDVLRRGPIKEVEDSLLISFHALKSNDPMMQNIYLDIACFFIERDEEEVVKIMETSYTFVNRHIDILKKRSFLTINNMYKLGMHYLLSDMGRRIARNNSPVDCGYQKIYARC